MAETQVPTPHHEERPVTNSKAPCNPSCQAFPAPSKWPAW